MVKGLSPVGATENKGFLLYQNPHPIVGMLYKLHIIYTIYTY